MCKTLRSAKELSDRGKTELYVLKAIRTAAYDFARLRARACLIDLSDEAVMSLSSRMADPLQTLLREEQRQQFKSALKRLPPDQRTLIEMFLQSETTRSLTAISQSTGLPVSTIRSRIQSGLRKIKKLIKKENPSHSMITSETFRE
jgi:RNA polymerase sigma factor (sigma-70 family)